MAKEMNRKGREGRKEIHEFGLADCQLRPLQFIAFLS